MGDNGVSEVRLAGNIRLRAKKQITPNNMSDRQKENASRIAAYLENKLSPTEREAFKRALSEDDGLRLQYVDALMNRAGTGTSAAPAAADEKGQPGGAGAQEDAEVADEWMGIVRGAEGARDEDKPGGDQVAAGGQEPGAAGGQIAPGGMAEAGTAAQIAGIGDREAENAARATGDHATRGGEEQREGRDDTRNGHDGGQASEAQPGWGAPRNWEAGEHAVVSGISEDEARSVSDEGDGARGGVSEGSAGVRGGVSEGGTGGGGGERNSQGEVYKGEWETRGEQGAREAWVAGWQGAKKERPGFLGSRWMVGLAVLLLIVAGLIVVMMVRRQGFWDRSVAFGADSGKSVADSGSDSGKAVAGANASPVADSGKAGSGATGTAGTAGTVAGVSPAADSVFARLYKPYMRGDDPLEIRNVYMDYRSGNYAAVLAVGDSTGLGVGKQKVVIRDYMRLYHGLSYLATGDAKDAVPVLEAVVLRTKPGDILYETAQWYLALAWVKRTDVDPTEAKNNALGLARDVSHGYSRYSGPAREFVKELGP